MKQVGEVGLRRWLGFAGDLGTWGNFTHHLDGDKGDGTVALSIAAGVARPPHVVFLRGDESEVQRRKWRGPRALCFAVATAWQSTRDPVSVVSLLQVEGGVAAARRRWVPHRGGLPGAVRSASFSSLSTQGDAWRFTTTTQVWLIGWVPRASVLLLLLSGVFSDRADLRWS